MAHTRHGRAAVALAAVAAAALLGGCAGEGRQDVHRVWPPPPAAPRIELQRIVQGAADFGKPGFFEGLGNLITGRTPQAISRPQDIAVDGDKSVYVTDHQLKGVHVFDQHSSKSSFISKVGDELLQSPVGVAVCDGKIAVSDSVLGKVFLLQPNGRLERVVQKPDGFKRPTGLAFDARNKHLYVVDTLAGEICVFDLAGNLVRRFGKPGTNIGLLNYPTYVALDGGGRIYVTDSMNFRVQVFDENFKYLFEIGKLGDATGYMAVPKGIGVDSFGHIYVVDTYLTAVQVFDQRGQFLLAFGTEGPGPGEFHIPTGLTVDTQNRIFVCDSFNRRIQIFQYIGTDNEESTAPNR